MGSHSGLGVENFLALSDAVYYDDVVGVSGTAWPIGTPGTPVGNATDAKAIAIARKLNTIVVRGSLTLNANMDGYNFRGSRPNWWGGTTDELDLGNQSVDGCSFTFLYVTGTQNGGAIDYLRKCTVGAVTGFSGYFDDCELQGITCAGYIGAKNCFGQGANFTLNYTGNFRGLKGKLNLLGLVSGNTINIWAQGADITIDSSCTGGFINIYGSATITDNNGGTNVTDYTLQAATARILNSMDFWSDVGEQDVVVTGTQGTVTAGLKSVVVAGLPAGATIERAIVMMKFRMVENTFAGVNKLDAAAALPMQLDDVANTGMLTCLDFGDNLFTFSEAAREGGDIIMGDIDVSARVDANDTYDFQWLNAKADQNNILFNDVQMGIRIWYSV